MALDAWYQSDPETNLENAKRWLTELDFDAMVHELNPFFAGKDIALRDTDDDEERYAFDYPMDDGALQGPEFEKVIRQGYLEAIALAQAHSPNVPIRTFWMTGVGNERFEMHICDAADHVAVTLLVPEVEGGSKHPRSPESWKVTAADDEVETRQMSGPPADEAPSLRGGVASS
jgi:hypothetical protein